MPNQTVNPLESLNCAWKRTDAQITSNLTSEERSGLEFKFLGGDSEGFAQRVLGPHDVLNKLRAILKAQGFRRIS